MHTLPLQGAQWDGVCLVSLVMASSSQTPGSSSELPRRVKPTWLFFKAFAHPVSNTRGFSAKHPHIRLGQSWFVFETFALGASSSDASSRELLPLWTSLVSLRNLRTRSVVFGCLPAQVASSAEFCVHVCVTFMHECMMKPGTENLLAPSRHQFRGGSHAKLHRHQRLTSRIHLVCHRHHTSHAQTHTALSHAWNLARSKARHRTNIAWL